MEGNKMMYVVMSEFKAKEIDDGDTHYRYVRVFSNKLEAENFAKKSAKKASGLPEDMIFAHVETTATPAPADVTLVAAV
jgi:hypothetical protein